MVKEKRILSYFFGWLIMFFSVMFIGILNVNALTFDNFEVTWYYRNKSNESQLLNVLKQEDVPLYASTNEYVNGYTTRVEQTFTKQIQYIVNYQLEIWFSPEQELNYRSDTLQRIIDYSYVDSDFKILNTEVKENWNRSSGSGITVLTINVSMQVLALNNTNAIRFGVYTTDNISIGFYNHSDQIDYYLVNNVSVEENANATIIDQNNQIINGQNNLQNSINNTQNNINSNIDDMEDAIIDSNNQTQEVIKDQFNTCRDSVNIFNSSKINTLNKNGITVTINEDGSLHFKGTATTLSDFYFYSATDKLILKNNTTYTLSRNTTNAFNLIWHKFNSSDATSDVVYMSNTLKNYTYTTNSNDTGYRFIIRIPSGTTIDEDVKIQLQEGNIATSYEPFGEEICQNKIDDTNDKLNGIQGALTDSSAPNTTGLENSAGWLPAGPLDSVLNLPLSLFNALTTNLNKSCNPINIPLPYVNNNITLPCINTLYIQIGITSFLSWIGVIVSSLMLYTYLLKLYKWIEDRISLNETHNVDSWGGL